MFQLRNLSIAAFLCLTTAAQASTVAIIDSGTDIKHPDLAGKIWVNPNDSLNNKDDDNNGFKDDVNGWNFFQNNNTLIDLKYDSLYSADIEKFFVVEDAYLMGTASDDDIAWIKSKAADQAFVSDVTKYGTFAHGTHVAGIAAKDNDAAKILTIRLVPVDNPLASFKHDLEVAAQQRKDLNIIAKALIQATLSGLAKAQGQAFGLVGEYAGSSKADVANASLGMGVNQAKLIVAPLVKLALKEDNDAATTELSIFFVNKVAEAQASIATSAPDTLFVFAAGNDGTDNDQFPTSPANIGQPNSISVGASIEHDGPAIFSNFGKTKVDVFAPGVAVLSSTPNNRHLSLSGTSQASPYVAGVAAGVKDANPALKPADMKAIILGTVDVKDSLKDKCVTSGIVNRDRAIKAAELSASMSVAEAIAQAKAEVADAVSTRTFVNTDMIHATAPLSPIIKGL